MNDKTLKGLVGIFRDFIMELRTNDGFDNGDGTPVDRNTDWDMIPECSVLTVFSLQGNNAPEIRGLSPKGVVITFPASVGGDIQIYYAKHIMAVRKEGSPAGWAYLGRDHNQKVYMDQDTADVLRDLAANTQYHSYVTDDSNQNISGKKDFNTLPSFRGDPLVYHSEFARLTSYVRNNYDSLSKLHQDIVDNSNDITLLSNDYRDVMDSLGSNYVKPDDLKNYAPLSQLDYYATKKDLTKYATTDDFQAMQSQLQRIADSAQHPVEDDLARVKDTIHKIDVRAENLNKLINAKSDNANPSNSDEQNIKKLLDQIDVSKIVSEIANLGNQTASLSNATTANAGMEGVLTRDINTVSHSANSLASSSQLLSSGVSTNARRLNSADNRFAQLNQHNHKVDTRFNTFSLSVNNRFNAQPNTKQPNADKAPATDDTVSMSAELATDASRLNSADTDLYKIKQHDKKSDKRYTDEISSLASRPTTANGINTNTFATKTSLNVVSNYASQVSANEKIDVQSLANKISGIANQSAEAKISSISDSAKQVQASQSATNTSLSNALSNNASQTTSVENDLISALSKHQL